MFIYRPKVRIRISFIKKGNPNFLSIRNKRWVWMSVIHANTKPFSITSVSKLTLGYKGVNGDPLERCRCISLREEEGFIRPLLQAGSQRGMIKR